MSQSIGVLFVCLGNICRSPLARAMFSDLAQRRGVADRFDIEHAEHADDAERVQARLRICCGDEDQNVVGDAKTLAGRSFRPRRNGPIGQNRLQGRRARDGKARKSHGPRARPSPRHDLWRRFKRTSGAADCTPREPRHSRRGREGPEGLEPELVRLADGRAGPEQQHAMIDLGLACDHVRAGEHRDR